MSADGSRLAFAAVAISGIRQLYLHIDGRRTAWVSESELDPSDPNYTTDPTSVRLRAMTPDGRNVFFITDTPLVSQDTNSGPDLYRWTDSPNPSTDRNLTLITQDGAMSDSLVAGVSDDGQRVYYQSLSDRRGPVGSRHRPRHHRRGGDLALHERAVRGGRLGTRLRSRDE